MKTQEDGYYIDMSKVTAIKLLKILRDLVFCFVVCILLGAINSWLDEQFFWILAPILSVVGAVFIAIGRMKTGKGERSTYPLCDQMDDYYAKNKNYIEIEAEIKNLVLYPKKDLLLIVVAVDDALCEEYELDKEQAFAVVYQSKINLDLNVGDRILFTTAPQKYFDKHNPPVVSIKKGDITILDLKQGKESYRCWVRENIK